MAFENLEPFREQIIALRADGKKLHELVEYLSERHNLRTTTGTLSRYLQQTAPKMALRELRPEEKQLTDFLLLQTELLAEVRGRGNEVRLAIEHHAGQIAVLSEEIEELRADLAQRTPGPDKRVMRINRIWYFLAGMVVAGAIAAGLPVMFLRG